MERAEPGQSFFTALISTRFRPSQYITAPDFTAAKAMQSDVPRQLTAPP
ncbi:hypothetical protein [Streptomyces atratus]